MVSSTPSAVSCSTSGEKPIRTCFRARVGEWFLFFSSSGSSSGAGTSATGAESDAGGLLTGGTATFGMECLDDSRWKKLGLVCFRDFEPGAIPEGLRNEEEQKNGGRRCQATARGAIRN